MNNQKELPIVKLYSDGGADPNPGKGGYGIIMTYKRVRKEFSQGFLKTTNNRMELLGVISGLERLTRQSKVNVYTDSRYVINGIEKGWARKWRSNNWYRNKTEKALNPDLWERLLQLLEIHQVKFDWVKGHNGHPENERCDALATQAMKQPDLIADKGFEESIKLAQPNKQLLF